MTLRRHFLTVVLIATLPAFAQAQTPASPQQNALSDRVKIGQNVRVTDAKGFELRGTVTALSLSEIELETAAGLRRITMSDVWTVSKKDSNTKGFYVGFATGCLTAGLGYTSILGDYKTKPEASQLLQVCGFFGLGTGLLGAWIDSFTDGRELLYQRPDRKVAVRVAPLVTVGASNRVGIAGSIAWK